MATKTQNQKIRDYLFSGKTLTAPQADNLFGVKNMRARMSEVREHLAKYGNYEVVSKSTATTGGLRYSISAV
jgi:hypothetical protein